MQIPRDWATPLTAGAFGLLTVTGVLMVFHLDSGLNKVAHGWLGWAPLARLAAAPLPVLAAVDGATEASSVTALVGNARKQQIRVLGLVLATR